MERVHRRRVRARGQGRQLPHLLLLKTHYVGHGAETVHVRAWRRANRARIRARHVARATQSRQPRLRVIFLVHW